MISIESKHALFWKVLLICLGIISLSAAIFRGSEFWNGYVLDIAGPAWCYILIRVLYRTDTDKFLGIRFSPEIAFLIILGACFIIEGMQYLKVYKSTFDPYDLLSYFSGLILVYLTDKALNQKETPK